MPHAAVRPWARAVLGLLGLAAVLGLQPAVAADLATAPALPADCAVAWQVELLPDTQPRSLRVTLSFDAGNRLRSTLRLPAGWAAVEERSDNPAGPRLQPVADEPMLRRVAHSAGERVQLRWRQALPAAAGAPEPWWLFTGQAVLPVPDELEERAPGTACIGLSGPAATAGGPNRWLSSHGAVDGPSALWRLPAGGGSLRSRVQQALYAGGAWQLQAQVVEGQSLTVARPDSAALVPPLAALALAGSQALAAQRRHWGETQPGPPLMLWGLPLAVPAGIGASASAWHQTAVVQAPAGIPLPAAELDAAVTQALSRLWLLDRFGPLVQVGRDDEALRRWFSEGVADFLAHQALLRDQRWSAADLAAHYNRQIERWADRNPPGRPLDDPAALAAAAARGEWLALQWHALLRSQGQPGLDALMRRLLLAPAQARREGPISAPLATHRLVAALRARLGDHPLREVQRVVVRGEPAWVYPDTLAACFSVRQALVAPWRLGFDAASLASKVVAGVQPDGPAAAAGLQDGMVIASHLLVPGDASQAVQLQLRAADGNLQALSYLPAGQPARELLRLQARPQALQLAACQGWLGLGPEASAARRGGSGHSDPAGAAADSPNPALADARAPLANPARGAKAGGRAVGKAKGKAGVKAGVKTTSRKAGKASTSATQKSSAKGAKTGQPARR